jgi:hypothetical protein
VADEVNTQIKIDLHEDVLMGAVRKIRQTFRVGLTAQVKSEYRATSRADVTFPVRWLATNREVFEEPPAPGLPVVLPRGGGYGVHFDLRAGDPGVAVALDGPVSGFYDTGQPVTPQFPQGHDYGCAVFFPCGRVSNEETPTEPPNPSGTMTVGAEDGTATVELRGAGLPSPSEGGTVVLHAGGMVGSVLIGSDTATVPVACEPQVQQNLASLNTRIQAWVPVPNDGGASLKPIIAAWFAALQNMADAKARVEGPAAP